MENSDKKYDEPKKAALTYREKRLIEEKSRKIKSKMKKLKILVVLALALAAYFFFFRCPTFPLEVGEGNPGAVFMETDYSKQSEDKRYIYYKVKFPKLGITGEAKLDYKTNNFLLVEEEFDKWILTFEYSQEICRYSEIPSQVNIYCKNLFGKKLQDVLSLKSVATTREDLRNVDLTDNEMFVLADIAKYMTKSGKEVSFKTKFFDVSDPTGGF